MYLEYMAATAGGAAVGLLVLRGLKVMDFGIYVDQETLKKLPSPYMMILKFWKPLLPSAWGVDLGIGVTAFQPPTGSKLYWYIERDYGSDTKSWSEGATGLFWARHCSLTKRFATWQEAYDYLLKNRKVLEMGMVI